MYGKVQIRTDCTFSSTPANHMPRVKGIGLILVLAVALPGCSLLWDHDDGPGRIVSGTTWELRRVYVSDMVLVATDLERRATIQFSGSMLAGPSPDTEAGEVSGFTGCNQYGGQYYFRRLDPNAGEARFSSMYWTEIGCSGLIQQVEAALLGGLVQAATYTREGDLLRIQVASDAPEPATELEFQRLF